MYIGEQGCKAARLELRVSASQKPGPCSRTPDSAISHDSALADSPKPVVSGIQEGVPVLQELAVSLEK